MTDKAKLTLKQTSLGFSAAWLVRLLKQTYRWEEDGLYDTRNQHWSLGEPVILACWHSQQLFMPWIHRGLKANKDQKSLHVIVSEHGDGRLAASLLQQLRICTIPGSSTRGGARALVRMAQTLKAGNHVAITPDGPKGPKEVVKPGVVKLASLTGAPIVPIAFNARRKWIFNSWDALFIPKPFTRTIMLMGEKFPVAPGLSREELAVKADELTERLHALNAEIDQRLTS